jgi:hypothetical protein
MKTIRHTHTLFYYDGPQVFEARDAIGGHYVAVMVEPDEARYLVTGVMPESLRKFRAGSVDLRGLLTELGTKEWFTTCLTGGLEEELQLEPKSEELANSPLLPDAGFVLHDLPLTEAVLVEARARNNVVLDVSVEPPEAAVEHRIRLETLVELLSHVQTLVKHAYSAAVRELALSTRRMIDRSEAHLLDVFVPAAPGSFRVMMEAAKSPDMLGGSEMVRALERVDMLLANAGNPTEALKTIKAHKGHLAGAYLRLLRFLAETKTGLRYSWASPVSSSVQGRTLLERDVGPLVAFLSGISNLGAEPVELTGKLDKADVANRTWRIVCEDGAYSGRIKEGGPSLDGLQIGARYKFSCIEEIEAVEGTGRELRQLSLVEHEPA